MSVKLCNSEDEFNNFLKDAGDKLVVVDFFATWCGPCKMIAPAIEGFAKTYDNVVFLKVDVDEAEDLAQSKEISAMPTFHFYKGGKKVDEITGANKDKIKDMIETHA